MVYVIEYFFKDHFEILYEQQYQRYYKYLLVS